MIGYDQQCVVIKHQEERIAELEAQVAALTEERDRWKVDYLEQVEKHNLTLDELREIEAELKAEYDRGYFASLPSRR